MNRLLDFVTDRSENGDRVANRFFWLVITNVGLMVGFTLWRTLLDNFAKDELSYTGLEIGILQSLREIPGFLAFTTVFLLLIIREQKLGVIMFAIFGLGVAMTGLLPSIYGLYFTTVIMSIGFHYFETVNKSLSLQWLPKDRAPLLLGRLLSIRAACAVVTLVLMFIAWRFLGVGFVGLYAAGGLFALALAFYVWRYFPTFEQAVVQRKQLILRPRYWLYYALTFMSGARRQIFVVFAGFMLIEKFGFQVHHITLLYLGNEIAMVWLAPKVGRAILRYGERFALVFEYTGLVLVFVAYAFVSSPWVAAGLYVIDHFFFGFAIAMQTYFQKIADPADMASSASVSFTINHIAAVFIPVLFGMMWLQSPSAVFLCGAAMALASLAISLLVPRHPAEGNESALNLSFSWIRARN